MIKRSYIFIGICLLISFKIYGTAQVADRLIYHVDTLKLFANPLEDLYNERNPRPKSFGIQRSWSTACWRGYRATWLIENDVLYLVEIGSCHYYRNYRLTASVLDSLSTIIPQDIINRIKISNKETIYEEDELNHFLKKKLGKRNYRKYRETIATISLQPRETANLEELFPARFENGRVRADWFSGILRVPKGKLLDYVHMGYMSTYEFELVFEVENSHIIDFRKYSNDGGQLKEGYGILSATSYSFAVPVNFLDGKSYKYTLTDTVSYSDPDDKMSLDCQARFNNERLNPEMRRKQVSSTLDSLTQILESYKFEDQINDEVRWGTTGWVDGFNNDRKEFIRVFTIVNINGQMIMVFRSKSKHEDFCRISEYMVRTTRLVEFGF